MGKGLYVMVDKIITQDETSTSQNRLLTSKIVDLLASTTFCEKSNKKQKKTKNRECNSKHLATLSASEHNIIVLAERSTILEVTNLFCNVDRNFILCYYSIDMYIVNIVRPNSKSQNLLFSQNKQVLGVLLQNL